MKEQMHVPKLRFSGLNKASKYTQYKFDDIFVFSSGKNIKQNEASPEFITSCVRYGELYHMYGEVITKVINSTNVDHSELTFSHGNEILLPSAGEDPLDIGSASALTLKGVAIGRTINVLRPKGSIDYSHIYASYYINEKLRGNISKLARGASISNVYNSDLKTLKANLPELVEQQKIASFLTSVDNKITQLTEKHRLLKEYKKGVMQQIFSQQLRFKDEDGKAFPEWEFVPLNKLAHKQSKKNRDKTVKEVLTNSAKYGILLQSAYFDKEIAKEDNTDNYHVVDVDDFVYNPRISVLAPVGPIGRNKVILGVMSPLYSVFRFNNLVELDFIEHFFAGATWHKYIYSVANFGARHDRMNISSSDLISLPCPYPCLKEQQKIAQFLQAIDKKINAVAAQIKQTKQFKKGLLQQMFV